jgi:hypothetical protein
MKYDRNICLQVLQFATIGAGGDSEVGRLMRLSDDFTILALLLNAVTPQVKAGGTKRAQLNGEVVNPVTPLGDSF